MYNTYFLVSVGQEPGSSQLQGLTIQVSVQHLQSPLKAQPGRTDIQERVAVGDIRVLAGHCPEASLGPVPRGTLQGGSGFIQASKTVIILCNIILEASPLHRPWV